MRSGEVRASKLTIPQFHEKFPQDYETIMTSLDGQVQYQIRTLIHHIADHELEDVDSPEWLAVPAPEVHYREKEYLKVHCKVYVPFEDDTFNELSMNRVVMIPEEKAAPHNFELEFDQVISAHKETSNSAEKNGPILLQHNRKELKGGSTIYDVKFRTKNATTLQQGVYLCAFERQYDKLFLTSYITPNGIPSPFPRFPVVDLISCQKTNYDALNYMVEFSVGQETCLRCRGVGFPMPDVGMYDPDGMEILTSPDVTVTKYINVADARVVEATYTFRNPTPDTSGRYECKAQNEHGSLRLQFRILVWCLSPLVIIIKSLHCSSPFY